MLAKFLLNHRVDEWDLEEDCLGKIETLAGKLQKSGEKDFYKNQHSAAYVNLAIIAEYCDQHAPGFRDALFGIIQNVHCNPDYGHKIGNVTVKTEYICINQTAVVSIRAVTEESESTEKEQRLELASSLEKNHPQYRVSYEEYDIDLQKTEGENESCAISGGSGFSVFSDGRTIKENDIKKLDEMAGKDVINCLRKEMEKALRQLNHKSSYMNKTGR
ncbi:hypothetical protein ACFL6I_05625 [candidate division KSB1 bacterium]